MILTGHEDLRVIKTIESIKKNFEQLICEKSYEKITVKELCDRARINKKTFYHYYETLDALLAELQTELGQNFLKRVKDYRLPEELDQVNREFFVYMSELGEAYEKITLSEGWRSIRNKAMGRVNDKGWQNSQPYQRLSDFEKGLLMDYINESTLAAYSRWIQDGKKLSIDEVVAILNRLQLGGVNNFFKGR